MNELAGAQRDRLIAAIEAHRDAQHEQACCTTAAELALWSTLEQVKRERGRG